MRRLLPTLVLALAFTSCALIPNATVRVALPPGDPAARTRWAAVLGALPAAPGSLIVETVTPDAFPPPDLVWFDGNLDAPGYSAGALGTNGQVDALAESSGIPVGWFGTDGDRILPLAWAPWTWWTGPDHTKPAIPGNPLVPYADPTNLRALELATGRNFGASFGTDASSAVWSVWGTSARDEGKALSADQALTLWAENRHDRLWLNWADLASVPAAPALAPERAEAVPVKVVGFWWNAAGWNRDKVPGLLVRLWTAEAQKVWLNDPKWLPASGLVPVDDRSRAVQTVGQTARIFVVVGN